MERSDPEAHRGDQREGCEEDAVEAGLRAVFESDLVEIEWERHESVLDILGRSTGSLSVSLREFEEEFSPLQKHGDGPAPEPLPAQLGRYRLVGEIGRGGVGSILKARDVDLGRDVALKVLRDEYRDDPVVLRRFVEEAQIGGQLQHPGIVPVHEMGLVAGKRPYFAMKLVRGQTLAKHIQQRKTPSEDRQRFLGIFLRVCQTIAYAHARGVVHRDLKPLNIMVGAFGEVQVMDWGLAKILASGRPGEQQANRRAQSDGEVITTARSGGSDSASIIGSVYGTPAYMAPEQARGELESIDERTDVFGLGAILCEILTGDPPYGGETPSQIHAQAEKASLQDAISRIDACGADPEVISLAKRCLAVDARERPSDANAVALEIGAFLESLEERARRHQVRAARARMRNVALSVLVIAIAVGGVLIRRYEMEQRDTAARLLQRAVSEAERRAGQADAASTDLTKWSAAVEAARAARDLVTDHIDGATAAEVQRALDHIEENARLRRLLARIVETGNEALTFSESSPGGRIDQRYQDAFRDYLGGLFNELGPMETMAAAASIRQTGSAEAIARGLDDWAFVRWALEFSWSSVADLSIAVAPEPWRIRVWESLRQGTTDHLSELERVLKDPEIPAVLLTSCASALVGKDDLERERRLELAESLLRRALDRDPGSFRANERLASLLSLSDATRLEGLRYWTAARALRPTDPGFALPLGQAYEQTGQYAKALLEYAENLRALPGSWRAAYSLELLERREISLDDETLDAFIARIEGLPAAVKNHIPATWEVLAEAEARRYSGQRLEDAVSRARRRVRETARREPHVLLMLSRLLWASGRSAEAIRIAEEAELINGSSSLLTRYREQVAPRLVSCASVEAALESADRKQVVDGRQWRYRIPEGDFVPEWRGPDVDGTEWREASGNFAWIGLKSSQRIVLRQNLELLDPDDFSAIRLVLLSLDFEIGVFLNGQSVGGDVAPDPEVEGGEVRTFDLGLGAVTGANRVLVEARRISSTTSRPWLVPRIEWERRPSSRAGFFEMVRSRLDGEEKQPHLLGYLDARWLQLAGDREGAAEKLRAVVAHDPREFLPFIRLWECLRDSRGEDVAAEQLRRELEQRKPTALLPLPPRTPVATATIVDAGGVRLKTAPFQHCDPRVNHVATRWQVIRAADDSELDPAIDLISYRHLTELLLPAHALEQNSSYVWQAHHVGENGVESAATERVPFRTGDWQREIVPIDLGPYFNRDIVADAGDPQNDSLDDGLSLLVEDGYGGDPSVRGMPGSGRIQIHQLGDYRQPNAVQIETGDSDSIRVDVGPQRLDVIRFLLVGGHGNASLPVVIEYADGSVQRETLHAIDWVTHPVAGSTAWGVFPEGVQKIRDHMARVGEGRLSFAALYGVFDCAVTVDSTKAVRAITLEAHRMEGFFERTRFNLLAITGVRVP